MPELAESFILTAQLAQLMGVPLETDSRLVLPKHLEVSRISSGPFTLKIRDFACISGDLSIEEDLVDATPVRVQHQGKKGWILWKTKEGAMEIETRYGMTGSWSTIETQHTRLELKSPSGSIYFNDIRKFGGLSTSAIPVARTATALFNVGQLYHDMVEDPDVTLKEALVDQNFLFSGIGNYLVNEVCHGISLHPDTQVSFVSLEEFDIIVKLIEKMVRKGVECGGCTLRDFKDVVGRPGTYQNHLRVYNRKECSTCGGPIVPIRRSGETTSWVCKKCQDLRRRTPLR